MGTLPIECPKCKQAGVIATGRPCNFCKGGFITQEQRDHLDKVQESMEWRKGLKEPLLYEYQQKVIDLCMMEYVT